MGDNFSFNLRMHPTLNPQTLNLGVSLTIGDTLFTQRMHPRHAPNSLTHNLGVSWSHGRYPSQETHSVPHVLDAFPYVLDEFSYF